MRFTRWTRLPLALCLLATACDRSKSAPQPSPGEPAPEAEAPRPPATEAPRMLLYPTEPFVCTRGAALTPTLPVFEGGAPFHYKVSPALPAGLALDEKTGAIAGTPTKVAAQAAYEITAWNAIASVTTTVTLTVNDMAPAAPEVTLPPVVTVDLGTPTASTRDQGEGHVYEWTLTGGDLLSGQGKPSITFRAVEEGTLTAQVKVTSSGGSATGRGECRVVPKPDADFSCPASVRPGEDWMTVTAKAQEGATYAWSISPGSSGASIVEGQGTNTMRFASNPAFGTFQIQLVVTNQAGDRATSSGPVQIVAY